MTEPIKHRSEILFIYDVSEANPNGDPLEINRPRLDPDTGHNLVTDVRLKRTVRDYLMTERGYDGGSTGDIFIREISMPNGKGIQDGKTRGGQFGKQPAEVRAKVLAECIDVRLFGATIPLPEDSVTLTGPVQFRLARSLNRVEIFHVKGTGAFASESGNKQATFREEDFVHYSLIPFYGAINPITAKDTGMTETDAQLLVEALWLGTKHLHSRSKFGHCPRLLLKINYAEASSFLGELQRRVELKPAAHLITDKDIRSVNDFTLAIDSLVEGLRQAMNGEAHFGSKLSVASIEVAHDPALVLTLNNEPVTKLSERLAKELHVTVAALGQADKPDAPKGEVS